jgi:hypothetical protein
MFAKIMQWLISLSVLLGLLQACNPQAKPYTGPVSFSWPKAGYKASYQFTLPLIVDECSGAAFATDSSFYTHNDDGPATLYQVSYTGRLLSAIPIPKAVNNDWEDLTINHTTGTLYISDLGNNSNARRDLAIYPFNPKTDSAAKAFKIFYPQQISFPPSKNTRNYDCEAIAYRNRSLLLFTKTRGRQTVWLYQVNIDSSALKSLAPQTAVLLDSTRFFYAITGAALNPTGTQLALIGYGALFIFDISESTPNAQLFKAPRTYLKWPYSGQAEACWYSNKGELYAANETGRVFKFIPTNKVK